MGGDVQCAVGRRSCPGGVAPPTALLHTAGAAVDMHVIEVSDREQPCAVVTAARRCYSL
jgi:hypothetical protein